ncbi:hypothetical protein [Saccharopolyspora pogona]|uniref:hypothetical protein n=1 Tax=Saccharopolyspora pogona TaxID=333966 RepID=UPI0016898248|nr:hypothetical protein [Saccharopolyspora pogona]
MTNELTPPPCWEDERQMWWNLTEFDELVIAQDTTDPFTWFVYAPTVVKPHAHLHRVTISQLQEVMKLVTVRTMKPEERAGFVDHEWHELLDIQVRCGVVTEKEALSAKNERFLAGRLQGGSYGDED